MAKRTATKKILRQRQVLLKNLYRQPFDIKPIQKNYNILPLQLTLFCLSLASNILASDNLTKCNLARDVNASKDHIVKQQMRAPNLKRVKKFFKT